MKTSVIIRYAGVLFFSLLVFYLSAQVKIGDNPNNVNGSAILELEKSSMGLLIPRVNLTGATDVTTIASPANSLLVFNLNTEGTGEDAVSPGFYYWNSDNVRWTRLQTGNSSSGGDLWIDPNGNILTTNSANQYLQGQYNIVIGGDAFEEAFGSTTNVIAIGQGAAQFDSTPGDARNIAIGYQAAYNNRGYDVTIMGREAGMNNRGNNVVAVGDYTAYHNTGHNVNAQGMQAAYQNAESDINAFGFEAAYENTQWAINAMGNFAAHSNDGYIVNALGPQACQMNSGNSVNALGHIAAQENTGSEVNAMGAMAAQYNTNGNVNAIGNSAAKNNSGYSVNALGFYSALDNSGNNVNALGPSAAQSNGGNWVNAIGQSAAANNSGWNVTAIGYEAALDNNGNDAIAIGQEALKGNGTIPEGDGNIGIGYRAGMNIGAGFNNIAIGYDAQLPDGYASDQINIGNNIIRDSNGVIHLKDIIKLTPTTAPQEPDAGTIYFDSSDNTLYCFDGTTWQALW